MTGVMDGSFAAPVFEDLRRTVIPPPRSST
jgi:hypothetical protein